jgi:hypothetical protein
MTNRPYMSLDTDRLAELARGCWSDPDGLGVILAELGFRSRPKAMLLGSRITKRLEELRNPSGQANGQSADPRASSRIAELEAQLKARSAEMDELRARCARAEAVASKATDPLASLYAQVWLTPGCPDIVLDAVRRTIRKEHHPDHAPPAGKPRAEEMFKRYENVFDRISQVRR